MFIETIVRFTLGVKDHLIATTRFTHNELWIELGSGNDLPSGISSLKERAC